MLYMRFEHINFGIEVSENVEVLSMGNLVEEDTVVVFYFVDENFRVPQASAVSNARILNSPFVCWVL